MVTMGSGTRESLEAILLERGAVSAENLQSAVARQRLEGGLLREILLEMGVVAEDELLAAVGRQAGLPFLSLAEASPGLQKVTDAFPLKFMQRYSFFPLRLEAASSPSS